jgi:transposase
MLVHEEARDLASGEFELIGEKITYRLAQRPGSYVILKYHRPVMKRKDTQTILTAPAPEGFLEGSRADVSFAAGLLMDKFAWHLPLYRQHQRLAASGITVSRPWLTQLAQSSISLLEPIYQAQFASIRASRVKTMDETPIKAGRSGHGKMQTGYFWPVYGEEDEVCFPFHPSRSADFVASALGLKAAVGSVLLTDGYAAYERYAEKIGITHAQCWAHSRRGFFEALDAEPAGAASALEQIKAMYAVEEDIRDKKLAGEAKQIHRLMYSKPLVEYFFDWVDRELARQGFTPSNPYIQALNYVRERRARARGLSHRSGCSHRYQSYRARLAGHSDGQKIVVILLDRARRQTRRHHPIIDRYLPTARRRSLYLPRRCPAARLPASCQPGRRAHPATLETAFRGQTPAVRLARPHRLINTSRSYRLLGSDGATSTLTR